MITEYVEVTREPPAALLTCDSEPSALDDDADEATFWNWWIDALEAGRDCRYKLGQVRGLAG